MDTLYLKKGEIFSINNRSYRVRYDTMVIVPSSIWYKVTPSKAEDFFNKLSRSAYKRRWTRELHNVILHPSKSYKERDTLRTISGLASFLPYSGRHIRRIRIRQLDVFGPTINDTSRGAQTWLERTGNKLHSQSKQYLIKNNLLFTDHDTINPTELADNERVLRRLPYLEDARIIVTPSETSCDSADVLVLVKDVWTKAVNVRIDKFNVGRMEMCDKNVLGFGHEMQNNILWNTQEVPSTGYEGIYSVPNISGSFISGELDYYNSFHKESIGLNFERKFFTPNIKYAGGAYFLHTNTRVNLKNDPLPFEPLKYNTFDFWAGRAFSLGEDFSKIRHNFTITARINRNFFTARPPVTATSFYEYHNKTLLLTSLSYTRHSYFKSNFIYNFGRTEDIPIGSGIEFTLGQEFSEFSKRKYAAFKLSAGRFLGNWGYMYSSIRAGSFYSAAWKREQAVVSTELNYFSPLLFVKKYRFRQFFNLDYTEGCNRFQNEYLLISEKSGITGLLNDSVKGSKRLNVRWETDCFTPWEFYDFHFVLFLFAQHSWLANSESIFKSPMYTGIGFGIRIRNERLVFNTLQLRFTFYPKVPPGSRLDYFRGSGEAELNQHDFLPQAPQMISYQ